MKTENNRTPSAISHRRYPSPSDNFARERDALMDLPIFSRAPRPDGSFRMAYLRLVIVFAAMLALASAFA